MQTNNQNQQQQQQTRALAPIQQVTNLLQAQEGHFNELIGQHNAMIKFKSEFLFACQAFQKSEFLTTTAVRNPQSLKNAILNVASVGLSLNPAEKQAYLVPRDGQVCLDISYIGLADLATQSGSVKWVQAKLVHQNDEYQFQGVGKEPLHKYNSFGDRGPVVGVYSIALTHDGQYLVEEMSVEQCHAIRNRSIAWVKKPNSGPWHTDEGEMMKKTVIKRASKLWPKAPKDTRLFKAIDVLNEHEGIDFEEERERIAEQKEALRLAAREKQQQEREEKDQLVNITIKALATELTTGMTAADKGKFMREHLGVPQYDHLNRLSLDELVQLEQKLQAMKPTNEGEPTNDDAGTNTDLQ